MVWTVDDRGAEVTEHEGDSDGPGLVVNGSVCLDLGEQVGRQN
jgi:hypothetical protein